MLLPSGLLIIMITRPRGRRVVDDVSALVEPRVVALKRGVWLKRKQKLRLARNNSEGVRIPEESRIGLHLFVFVLIRLGNVSQCYL